MISRRTFLSRMAIGTVGLSSRRTLSQQNQRYDPSQLEAAFVDPPNIARPWVYWFWVNGNVTREGITADLEAMHRVGIGGVLIMDVDPGTPAGPTPFASPAWWEAFRFACEEAKRLGLQVNMYNAAGWAGSGGPWITPELSMQKVVWSELQLEGGRPLDVVLPQPVAVANYYRDIGVVSFPTLDDDSYRIPNIAIEADYEAKSTPYDSDFGLPPLPNSFPPVPLRACIDRDQIRDLTAQFHDGHLSWDAPPGRWTVVRFGHTSTGVDNHPTPESGHGLECDKLSKAAVRLHFSRFLDRVLSTAGPLAGKTLVSTHIDSWEAGAQNWTPAFRNEFQKRCGYDLLPFLPAMTGRVVSDLEISERFLWDLRKTVSDLLNENYAGCLRELAHEHGLRLSIEAYDGDPGDEMAYAGQADEPQGEFWYGRDYFPEVYRSWSWVLNMVSASHVYGKRITAAESFTAMPGENWLAHPAAVKALGDWAFCAGINRFIFHRYAMQPWGNRAPGMTMGPWGLHYERTQTWWEETGPWHEYLTRCQFLLRQGLFVADLLYLQPEGAPMRFRPPHVDMRSANPPETPGYNYDGCTPEVVMKRVSIREGNIVLPDGMTYRVLVLPEPGEMPGAGTMTPQLLTRIAELVEQGMIVVGSPPSRSPSLSNYPACDEELRLVVERLWGNCDGVRVQEHRVGAGRVVWGKSPEEVLGAMGIPVDISCQPEGAYRYIHRRTADGTEIFFVANKEKRPVQAMCTFRVSGKRPEFWWPESGRVEKPAVYDTDGMTARVPIHLEQSESVFVVFPGKSVAEADRVVSIFRNGRRLVDAAECIELTRAQSPAFEAVGWRAGRYILRTANHQERILDVPPLPDPVMISGPWSVVFTPNWGAPDHLELKRLISWTEHEDPGVRHFSGKATYRTQCQIPASMMGGQRRLYLDLGAVEVMAAVKLNGYDLGVLWKSPFQLDVTQAARSGLNSLEVRVVNLWPNRLIGDAALPEDCEWKPLPFDWGQQLIKWPTWLIEGKPSPTGRFTFTTFRVWTKDAQLIPSGLLGPVTIRSASRVRLD